MGHTAGLHLWVDATAGIAGDMLLGALIDAGATLDGIQSAVAAVVPGEVALRTSTVQRSGLRALKLDVESRAEDHPHRSWARIRSMLETAELTTAVRTTALATFARLADAEARVHGVSTEDVHFHEVGSWDSIADIVGVCAALAELAVTRVTASPVAVGSGRIGSVHGDLPVPPPAVLELARGWQVLAGGDGELATPTGMALIRALADECTPIAPMEITAVGVGAGGRDVPGRANVVRVALGIPVADVPATESMWVLETNIDDLDPRVWPTVLAALLEGGAADAWLVPIVMKKGRPAHTLCVLARDADREVLRDSIFGLTSTIGVREAPVSRVALDRDWRAVALNGGEVRIKVALRADRIVHATPEFDDAAALARARDVPVRQVLDEAIAAAEAAMLRPGAQWPGEPCDQDGAAI
ncbi:TIGR00299 family protein [Mycolicibacterium rhodesiae NBB3]|uniref:Pyridinium-3,5-bisthiocarboxylic acid mononucleotide nickel insertion protein n=1 Tax=Mycolicibacterium rhodesiae (strain NBB3) TaxID=710685 RepID=G8RVA6_MYCRN|nr:nickel pincer cofactor biosynthesis protein LarC [Mycolicibacterium rhodesiae]AEV72978.1 TIGR00299 family protein [Mycolicibacterium rhodesiae NBB3]